MGAGIRQTLNCSRRITTGGEISLLESDIERLCRSMAGGTSLYSSIGNSFCISLRTAVGEVFVLPEKECER